MIPRVPTPYRTTSYARPNAELYLARRIRTPDGALLASFVYGPAGSDLARLIGTEPVLLLHGNGGSHGSFCKVIDALCTAGLGVIALDSRAQGQSSRGTRRLTYELMAEDALCVLDELGVSRTHVLGYSDGGIEALLLARDHGDRVRSIVTSGANLTPDGVIDDPAWDTPGSADVNGAWASFMEDSALPTEVDPRLLPSPEEARLTEELLRLMLEEPHIEASSLARIHCPACIMVGEHDCITAEETEAIVSNIPGARLVTIAGAGHSLPRQAPDSLALQVLTNVLIAQEA